MSVCVCVCLPVCLSVCLQDLVQLMWNLAWLCQLKQNSNPLFHIYDFNNHICCFNYKSLSASCHRAIALCKIYHKIKHTEQHYRYTDIFTSQNPKALPGEIVFNKKWLIFEKNKPSWEQECLEKYIILECNIVILTAWKGFVASIFASPTANSE